MNSTMLEEYKLEQKRRREAIDLFLKKVNRHKLNQRVRGRTLSLRYLMLLCPPNIALNTIKYLGLLFLSLFHT